MPPVARRRVYVACIEAPTGTAKSFLLACRGEPTDHVPVWFMRQAGRSLPEYRKIRESYSLLEICERPEVAAEVTMQPVRRLGVDAAILFSDIVVPLRAVGIDLQIEEGVGPVIAEPIREPRDLERLRPLEPEGDLPFVIDTISLLVDQLEVPLIGFAGAPFTLACYLVEGGPSRDQARTKVLMYSQPDAWHDLMDRLTAITLAYLRAQVEAGVSAIQLFDSWVGTLARSDYETFVLPYVARIMNELQDLDVPRIVFGIRTGELLRDMAASGAEVVGVDHRLSLVDARSRVGSNVSLQGNLDPSVCLAPWEVVESKALHVLRAGGGRAHIFNLGHGVLPDTDPDTLARLVELVHGWTP